MSRNESEESYEILLLAEDFHPITSGGAFIDWNVAKYLANKGDEVTVVTPRTDSMNSREVIKDVEIRRPFLGVSEEAPQNSFWNQIRRVLFAIMIFPYLVYLAYDNEFDVIYSTNHLFHPISAVLRTLFSLPVVTFVGYSPSIHDDVSLCDPLVILEQINFRFFMGDRALCQTPSIQKELNQHSNAIVERLDGCVDPHDIRTALEKQRMDDIHINPRGEILNIIFVGRLSKLKNVSELVYLMADFPDDYSLTIVGDGPEKVAIEEAIYKANVGNRVNLTGRLSHEQTLQAIHKSDILILPSKADAYPAVVFEALALNTPVLATPVGALPTIDHPKLTISELESFNSTIQNIEPSPAQGIDEETLEMYSVDRFAEKVRDHLIAATKGS